MDQVDQGAYPGPQVGQGAYPGPQVDQGAYPGPQVGQGAYPGPQVGQGAYPGPGWPRGIPRTRWRDFISTLALKHLGCPSQGWLMWPRKGMFASSCWNFYFRDPSQNKRLTMDEWMEPEPEGKALNVPL